MSRMAPSSAGPLPAGEARELARVLASGTDLTVFVDGTVHRLMGESAAAVIDVLGRLSRGEAITVSSAEDSLTVAQAAALAGISHSYLRNLTDRGDLPVQYRGSHRRILRSDVLAWLAAQKQPPATEG
ncbi:MAG: helix-turn-helix domain-containing protein [Actinomycetales bacterium]